jgi:hypothetical protein
MRHFSMQLKDLNTGEAIITAGGVVYVAVNGSPDKQALVNKDGSALSNPITPTRGKIEFWVASDDVTKVDLYGMAPGGQAFQRLNVTASGPNEIGIDTSRRHQELVIPFSIADTTANTETDTGFDTGTDKMWLPNPMVKVVTLDDTETVDVGTDGAGSNDPNGFVAAASLSAAALVPASILNGAVTLGALFIKQDSANAGDATREGFVNAANENITYTLSPGTDTAKGFFHLPYLLAA